MNAGAGRRQLAPETGVTEGVNTTTPWVQEQSVFLSHLLNPIFEIFKTKIKNNEYNKREEFSLLLLKTYFSSLRGSDQILIHSREMIYLSNKISFALQHVVRHNFF